MAKWDYDGPILEIENLSISFFTRLREIPAVMDFSCVVQPGEAMGLVGESGCGKSTVALGVMQDLGVNGKIVGGTGWTDWKDEVDALGVRFASADIGYWIAADQSGKGVVTRCVEALTRYAFEEYDLHRLTIRAEPENPKSWKVAERCGYEREGTLCGVCLFRDRWIDHHLYAKINPAHK